MTILKITWEVGQLVYDLEFIDNLINLLMDKYSINAERFKLIIAAINASFAALNTDDRTFDNCNARNLLQFFRFMDQLIPWCHTVE